MAEAAEQWRGGRLVVEFLKSLGVTDLFSLPGTQTMPLYDELRLAGGIRLHSFLHDAAVISAADGWGRVTGRLAVASVYEFAGFANAAGAAYSALLDRRPMLILGTNTDARQSGRAWSAEVPDLAAFGQQLTRRMMEVHRADRLEETLRRAAHAALTTPQGPVFVGIPANLYYEHVPAPRLRGLPSVLAPDELPSADPRLAQLAEALLEAEDVTLVAGGEVTASGAAAELARFAERWALPVFSELFASRLPMSTVHPNYFGACAPDGPLYKAGQVVLALGAKLGRRFAWAPADFVWPHQRLFHSHVDPEELGRVYPTEVALQMSAPAALRAIDRALEALHGPLHAARIEARRQRLRGCRAQFQARCAQQAAEGREDRPARPASVLRELGRALRPEDLLFDELMGLRPWLPAFLELPGPERFHANLSGFMGWGIPAATGAALGVDRGKVVLVAGDGSALMAPQAMWNAAKARAPVVYVVMNNRGWVCLKAYYGVVRGVTGRDPEAERIGCDIDGPPVDFVQLALSFGVPGRRVETAAAAGAALAEALAAEGPFLLDVQLDQELHAHRSFPRP